jgi:hypothetical protein
MKKLIYPLTMTVVAISALVMVWPVPRVSAFNPQPDPPAFSMIGIDPFETVRLNALCADGLLPGDVPPGPCDVTLTFRDMSGRTIKQMTATLQPGQGTFLDIRGMEGSSSGRRMEIQPRILPAGRGFILATVEVFDDATGRTAAILNPTEPKSLRTMSTGGQ